MSTLNLYIFQGIVQFPDAGRHSTRDRPPPKHRPDSCLYAYRDMTKAEKECSQMGPGFRKMVRTLRLLKERELRESQALARKAKRTSCPLVEQPVIA